MPIYNLIITVTVDDEQGDRLEKHPTQSLVLVDDDVVMDAYLADVRYIGE